MIETPASTAATAPLGESRQPDHPLRRVSPTSSREHAGVILSGVVAVGFGWIYLREERNLWASIITHGIYDTIGFIVVFLSLDKMGA